MSFFPRLRFSVLLSAILFVFIYSSEAFSQTDTAGSAEGATPSNASSTSSADGIPTDAAVISGGEALFKANCTQCHGIDDVVVGPALRDAHKRWQLPALINFIKYPQKTIESGDKYAKGLYDKYKQFMPNHDFLKDTEVLSLIAYIKAESVKPPSGAVAAAGADSTANGGTSGGAGGVSSNSLNLIMSIVVVVLIIILVVLLLISSILKKFINERVEIDEAEDELVNKRFNFVKILKSKAFVGIVVFVFACVILQKLAVGTTDIGVQQNYAPNQPIAFSHKIHAGKFKIDCNYCHTGVNRGKNANIPSANICMNCHTEIKKESPEIAKIYRALDYNPADKTYGPNQRPIQWVRVHNLPDLAYFNHAQHVNVGGLACQTCHGPIEEMDVVKQYNSLTMGWCINCHRQTVVNTEGNAYYDKLVELHKKHSKEPLKVKDIGGLECSKCHY